MPAQPEEGEQATQGLPLLPAPPPPPQAPEPAAPPSAAEPAAPEPAPPPLVPEPAAPPPAPEPAAHRPHSHRRTGQPVYHTSAVYGGKPEPKPVKRRTIAMALTGGGLAAVLVGLVLVLTVFKSSNPPPAHGIIPTGTSPQQDGQQVASALLRPC